jgi:hypothetical protein
MTGATLTSETRDRICTAIDVGISGAWAIKAGPDNHKGIADELISLLSPSVGPITVISVGNLEGLEVIFEGLWIFENADKLEENISLSGWIKIRHDINQPSLKMIFLGESLEKMMRDKNHPLYHFYTLIDP